MDLVCTTLIVIRDKKSVPNSARKGVIFEYTYMRNQGEHYSMMMRLLPPSYRMFQPPAVLYDSMIFVSDVVLTGIVLEE